MGSKPTCMICMRADGEQDEDETGSIVQLRSLRSILSDDEYCDHSLCTTCWPRFLEEEIVKKKRAYVNGVCCPEERCKCKVPTASVRTLANKATLAVMDEVLATIPKAPKALADFGYTFSDEGKLVTTAAGKPFHFVSQLHYEALGDFVTLHIQHLLRTQCKLQEVHLPVDAKEDEPTCNIFLSEDALTNPDTLFVIVQGSGAVRPGQWARALCINDSLQMGTIIPYLEEASKRNWPVIVLNPNMNKVEDDPPTYTQEDFLRPGRAPQRKDATFSKIRENESPGAHINYVYDEFISKAKAKDIIIVAHSAGGACTMHLLCSRGDILQRLRAIAFTDSVHGLYGKESKEVREFVRNHAINWEQSDLPLDTPLRSMSKGCRGVSAGHPKHEYTSPIAMPSVFKFLDEQLAKGNGEHIEEEQDTKEEETHTQVEDEDEDLKKRVKVDE